METTKPTLENLMKLDKETTSEKLRILYCRKAMICPNCGGKLRKEQYVKKGKRFLALLQYVNCERYICASEKGETCYKFEDEYIGAGDCG